MTVKDLDLVGIGSAVVDVIYHCPDHILELLGVEKGSMTLLTQRDADVIYNFMVSIKRDFYLPPKEICGGSTGNIVSGFANLGGKAAFNGRLDNDYFGNRYIYNLSEQGIECSAQYHSVGITGTGRSYIFFTSDLAKTLCTYLGASSNIEPNDIDEELIKRAKMLLIEGYMLDCKNGKIAVDKAINYAKKYNCKIILTLCDPALVQYHKKTFLQLIDNDVDVVIANKREVKALFGTADLNFAIKYMRAKCQLRPLEAVITCGRKGTVVMDKYHISEVGSVKPIKMINSIGAGDLFVSGFLYGCVHGYTLSQATRLGNLAAAEVLRELGGRLDKDLSSLVTEMFSCDVE